MQISGNPTWAAPQTTGHPLGLPAATQNIVKDTQIASARAASDSALGQGQGKPFLPGLPLKTTLQGEPTVAPPSIMQLKISSLLREQADARAEEAADRPEPQEDTQTTAPITVAAKSPAQFQEPSEQTEAAKGYSAALETAVATTEPHAVTMDTTDSAPVTP